MCSNRPTDEDFLVAIESALEAQLLPESGLEVLQRARDAVLDAVAPLVAHLRHTPPVPSAPADRAELREEIAEALMRWAERNNDPQYAAIRRPDTVTQNAYGRADAVLAVLPATVGRAAVLREAADWFDRYDVDSARELRRMAAEAQQPEAQADVWHLTPQTLDLFVRALVNEVDYDIHKGYECGEEDGADHYPELVAEAAEMLNAITAEQQADTAGEQQ